VGCTLSKALEGWGVKKAVSEGKTKNAKMDKTRYLCSVSSQALVEALPLFLQYLIGIEPLYGTLDG
jgi:hypothetical protein